MILIAKITSSFGIKGAVKIKSFTENPLSIFDYKIFDENNNNFTLNLHSVKNDVIIAFIEGVNTKEEADSIKNTNLYVERSDLPELEEEEFYYSDLISLRVKHIDGSEFGKVVNIDNYGAGDFIEIDHKGKVKSYSFTKEIIPKVNIKSGFIVINPPEEEYVES